MRQSLLLLLSLAFIGCMAACGGIPSVTETPDVTVESASIHRVSFTGAEGRVSMHVFNPNAFDLPLSQVEWKLSVGGQQAVDGRFHVGQTLAARSSSPVDGELRIGASSAMSMARAIAGGARDFTIFATLHFQSKFGEVRVQVRHDGMLNQELALAN